MKKLARAWLLALLIVSLPFHAAYAVSMSQCVANAGVANAADPEQASHAAADADHCDHALPGSDSTGDTGDASSTPHCGSCSACATSIAISGTLAAIIASDYQLAPPSSLEQRLRSLVLSRLDRPPLRV